MRYNADVPYEFNFQPPADLESDLPFQPTDLNGKDAANITVYPPHTRAEKLPTEIRARLKPHFSHWLVLKPPENWRAMRSEGHTKLFVKTKKGYEEVKSAQYAPERNALIIVKNKAAYKQPSHKQPVLAGHYNAQASSPVAPPEPAPIKVNADTSPDEDDKRIIITLKGGLDASITVASKTNSLNRNNTGLIKNELLFARLKERDSYRLTAHMLGVPDQELTPSMPYNDYLNTQKIKTANIGEQGGMQLLEHSVTANGNMQLTLLTQPPSFGVFFDGTGNNLTNDNQDIYDDKEPTNVAKLYELYDIGDYVDYYYIEGIGTEANEDDSNLDLALALSFDEKILEAIDRLRLFLSDFKLSKIAFVDVFGFSRGATLARAFVNQIHEMIAHNPKYFGGIKPVIRFLGIFDTVSSTGGDGDDYHNEHYVSKNLPYPVNLDINANSVGVAYHQVAYDEHRDKFPLHSLLDTAGSTPSNVVEIALPGAHADVGGGYGPGQTVIEYPTKVIAGRPGDPRHDKKVAELKARLEKKYYWPSIDITLQAMRTRRMTRGHSVKREYTPYRARWVRQVDNTLPHYALHKVHAVAIEHGVPFQPIETLASISLPNGMQTYQYELSDRLKGMVESAISQSTDSYAWQHLYAHYIHHSHKYKGFTDKLANKKEENAAHTADNGVREVFYNDPSNAAHNLDAWQPYFTGGITQWRKK